MGGRAQIMAQWKSRDTFPNKQDNVVVYSDLVQDPLWRRLQLKVANILKYNTKPVLSSLLFRTPAVDGKDGSGAEFHSVPVNFAQTFPRILSI